MESRGAAKNGEGLGGQSPTTNKFQNSQAELSTVSRVWTSDEVLNLANWKVN